MRIRNRSRLTVAAAADLMPSLPAIDDQTATVGTAFSLTFDAATSGDAPVDLQRQW